MLKRFWFWTATTAFVTAMGLSLLPHANAQLSEQEFQMGRAREACIDQARQQSLIFNNVVSTVPTTHNGQMTGSQVILNVGRAGPPMMSNAATTMPLG